MRSCPGIVAVALLLYACAAPPPAPFAPGFSSALIGDTRHYRVDRPLLHPGTREPLQNFTRVEVFGSPSVNWVRVRAVEDGARVKFEVSPGR